MKTYVIVDVRITDPARYEDYKKLTPASLLPFDGRFLVRGGQTAIRQSASITQMILAEGVE